MEKSLFNSMGEPVAYISSDPGKSIYLWDGHHVAYLYDYHVYGFNGKHLGWFLNGIVYDSNGNRIGFLSNTCPVPVSQKPAKGKKYFAEKKEPRYEAPPLPDLSFNYSPEDFAEFLKQGQIAPYEKETS